MDFFKIGTCESIYIKQSSHVKSHDNMMQVHVYNIYILLIHAYVYIYIVIYYCSSYIKMLGSALWWLPSDISCLVEAVRESVDDMPSKVQRAAAATKKTEQKTRLHNGSEHVNVNFGIEVD